MFNKYTTRKMFNRYIIPVFRFFKVFEYQMRKKKRKGKISFKTDFKFEKN